LKTLPHGYVSKRDGGTALAFLFRDERTSFLFCCRSGDTGCDCLATSLRQGARSVTAFEILPPPPPSRGRDNPWPQYGRVFKVSFHGTRVSPFLQHFQSSGQRPLPPISDSCPLSQL